MPAPTSLLERAIALHRGGDLEAADAAYRQVLAETPDQPDALNFLGVLSGQRGEVEDGLELLWKSVQLAPGYVDAWVNFGNLLLGSGKLEAAERAYREALALDEDHVGAWFNLGALLRRQRQFEAAEAALRQVAARVPGHPTVWRAIAACSRQHGHMQNAVRAHRDALEFLPGDPSILSYLGFLYYAGGDREAAAGLFRQWLELEPDDPIAQHMVLACGGGSAPPRASDDYVRALFDSFAEDFDQQLCDELEYVAPQLVGAAVERLLGDPAADLDVGDLGCGTGLAGPLLQPFAKRLLGVDLSSKMLELARERGGYDELVEGELVGFLAQREGAFDLLTCVDTLCYFGELEAFAAAAFAAMRPDARLVFTVERLDGDSEAVTLQPSGRYAHAESAVRRALEAAGFGDVEAEHAVLRMEQMKPVHGLVVSARRPQGPPSDR